MITVLTLPNYCCLWEKCMLTRNNSTVTWTVCEAITFSGILAGVRTVPGSSALSRKSVCLRPCPQHRPLHPSALFLLPRRLPFSPSGTCPQRGPCAPQRAPAAPVGLGAGWKLLESAQGSSRPPPALAPHSPLASPAAQQAHANCTMCLSVLAPLSTFFLYMCWFPVSNRHVSSLVSFSRWSLSLL